ncbi:hypothetical protein V1525DRAFT_129335 [Lipomyces kononenkoae]|uniref:Uncharacterized protein n=1 Tax=Lipomyces kononenkoae TaxID=34357 RepID=A0ACC3T203_LIPKO
MPAETLVVRHMDPAAAGFHQPPTSAIPASQHMRKATQDIPPAVAALLAVTAIPPPRRPARRRKSSVKDESTETLQKSSRKPSLQQRSKSPSAHSDDAGTNSDTIPVRPKTSRKSSSLSSASSQSSSSSRRKVARQKQRTYPSELVELLTPPPVDGDSDSDSDETSIRSKSNGYRLHEVKTRGGWETSASTPPTSPPPLSRSVSSTDSSPRDSPTTPYSSRTEYFPIVDEEDSDPETDTLKSSSAASTGQAESAQATASRHRKHHSESIATYNDDPLGVAVDENGSCTPAMAFIPAHMKPEPSTGSIPAVIRPRLTPRRKSQQELLDEEYARQHSSMVAKINMSLRSLKWIASSMARHQEEYMSRDEIDHLEQHRPYRPVDRYGSKSIVHSASGGVSPNSAKSRSSSGARRHRSESVPARTDRPGKDIRYRSLSAGGVTARSSARALTMQIPISEKQTMSALCYTAPQSRPAGDVSSIESDSEEVEQLPCIQMQTYDVQQNCLPIFRPREPRMNGDFWRVLAMELQMRRHGKLGHDFYSGKARMVLAPRADYGHLEKKSRNWTPLSA